jgi:hypothetical protein
VTVGVVAAVELAVATHAGGLESVDLTYGSPLPTSRSMPSVGIEGLVRDAYLRWPVFQKGQTSGT